VKDEQIVKLYWQRDETAVQLTADKYEAYLTKIAHSILADIEDSKECVNDTYLRAWNSMPQNRPRVLSTFLGKLTRNISIDLFRRKNSTKRHTSEYTLSLSELEDSFPGGNTVESEADAQMLDKAIVRFLRGLPEEARNAFIARYYFFDSLKEVAAYCGMNQAKLKSLLYRTRQSLRAYLIKEGFEL